MTGREKRPPAAEGQPAVSEENQLLIVHPPRNHVPDPAEQDEYHEELVEALREAKELLDQWETDPVFYGWNLGAPAGAATLAILRGRLTSPRWEQ